MFAHRGSCGKEEETVKVRWLDLETVVCIAE